MNARPAPPWRPGRPGRAALLLLAAACAGIAAAQPADPQPAARATRHALIIAIGDYADPAVPPLKGTVHDLASARRMARAMAVPDAHVHVLRDREASGERIRTEIAALAQRVHEGDRVFVYYSGHGTRWHDPQAGAEGCAEGLLASDGAVLGHAEMARRLAPLARRADKMLVFYDACYAGGVARAPWRSLDPQRAGEVVTPRFTPAGSAGECSQPANLRARSLAQSLQHAQAVPQNVVHVASAGADEVSFDSSLTGGYATAAWRDCLLGQARDLDGSGAITVDEITRCAQSRVDAALAGLPGILGQRLTVAGNAGYVPAWRDWAIEANAPPAAAPTPASRPAPPAASTPAALLAELHAQRDGSRRVVATTRQDRLRIGSDLLELDVTSARDGHLYVALAGSDGHSLTLLYPNALATDNRVHAGQRVSLPGAGWEVVSGGPPGTETLLVLVTDAPRDLSALAQQPDGPFMKTLLDAQGRARLQAVFANGTPAGDCGRPGRAPCSDAFGAALLTVESVR